MPQAAYVRCNKEIQAMKNYKEEVSMPQAAYVRCNSLSFLLTKNTFLMFQCRKRHMFVATILASDEELVLSEFQCRKRHMFVATDKCDFHTCSFKVSMPQAAYVRCNEKIPKILKLQRSFNAASGICSLQLKKSRWKMQEKCVSMPQAAYVRCNEEAQNKRVLLIVSMPQAAYVRCNPKHI